MRDCGSEHSVWNRDARRRETSAIPFFPERFESWRSTFDAADADDADFDDCGGISS